MTGRDISDPGAGDGTGSEESVLEFLRGREDAVVFGAQAVNANVPEPCMTQDIDWFHCGRPTLPGNSAITRGAGFTSPCFC